MWMLAVTAGGKGAWGAPHHHPTESGVSPRRGRGNTPKFLLLVGWILCLSNPRSLLTASADPEHICIDAYF